MKRRKTSSKLAPKKSAKIDKLELPANFDQYSSHILGYQEFRKYKVDWKHEDVGKPIVFSNWTVGNSKCLEIATLGALMSEFIPIAKEAGLIVADGIVKLEADFYSKLRQACPKKPKILLEWLRITEEAYPIEDLMNQEWWEKGGALFEKND